MELVSAVRMQAVSSGTRQWCEYASFSSGMVSSMSMHAVSFGTLRSKYMMGLC